MNTVDFNYNIGQQVYIIGESVRYSWCMCGYGTVAEMKINEKNEKSYYVDNFGWFSEDRIFDSSFTFSAKIEEMVEQARIKREQDQEKKPF